MDRKTCLGAMKGLVRMGVLPAPLGERLEQVTPASERRVVIPCAPVSKDRRRAPIEGRLFYIPDATVSRVHDDGQTELDVYSPCTPGRRQPSATAYRAMHEVLTLLSSSDDTDGIRHADVLQCLTTTFVTMPPLHQAALTALLTRYYPPPDGAGEVASPHPPLEPFQIFLVPRAAKP